MAGWTPSASIRVRELEGWLVGLAPFNPFLLSSADVLDETGADNGRLICVLFCRMKMTCLTLKHDTEIPYFLNSLKLKKKKTLHKLQNIIRCLFFQACLSSSISICL